MAIECTETQEWIEEEVWGPVEEWVEKTQKKCKDYGWYDPRGWFCWFVTTVVKVVTWTLHIVGKWVVRTVCKVVGAVLTGIRDLLQGLWDVIVGIFTLDWQRIVDGLLQAGLGLLDSLLTLLRVLFLLDTLQFIADEIRENQLKAYIRTKLGFEYIGQNFQDIVDNLRLDHGAFGYRIGMESIRTFVDSETRIPEDNPEPNLFLLHEAKKIDLKGMCGFSTPEGYWNAKRYKTLKKGPHATGGGGGEVDNPISEEELDLYINSRGSEGPPFIILCMRDGVLDTKLRAAELTARQIGLMPQWTRRDFEVTNPDHINHKGLTVGPQTTNLVKFLLDPIGRAPKQPPYNAKALADLCKPVAIGVFQYEISLRGITACLEGSKCTPAVGAHTASGLTYIDNKPDIIWKYVPIHELGHYFGLCHVQGLERIMYTPKGDGGKPLSWWEWLGKSFTWWTIPDLILFRGEPSFTLDEAMAVWDYIIEHFPARCLGAKGPIIL